MTFETEYKCDLVDVPPLRSSLWKSAVIAVVLICSVVVVMQSVMSFGFLFEKNYNEGWNVYNAQRLIDHEVIYDDNYWRANNYPIISFVIVAGLNLVVHDLLLSGRLVALGSFIAIGALAAVITRRLGGSRSDAAFSGGGAVRVFSLIGVASVPV